MYVHRDRDRSVTVRMRKERLRIERRDREDVFAIVTIHSLSSCLFSLSPQPPFFPHKRGKKSIFLPQPLKKLQSSFSRKRGPRAISHSKNGRDIHMEISKNGGKRENEAIRRHVKTEERHLESKPKGREDKLFIAVLVWVPGQRYLKRIGERSTFESSPV